MVTGKQPFDLPFKPLTCALVLATGAVAVTASTVDDVGCVTIIALKGRSASLFGAAFDDGINHLMMFPRHGVAKTFDVFGAELAENIIEACRCHGQIGTPSWCCR